MRTSRAREHPPNIVIRQARLLPHPLDTQQRLSAIQVVHGPASGDSHTAPHCHPHHWKFGPAPHRRCPPRNGGVDASWRRMAVYPRARAAVWRSTASTSCGRPGCGEAEPSSFIGPGPKDLWRPRHCSKVHGSVRIPPSDLHHSDFARLIHRPATAEQGARRARTRCVRSGECTS